MDNATTFSLVIVTTFFMGYYWGRHKESQRLQKDIRQIKLDRLRFNAKYYEELALREAKVRINTEYALGDLLPYIEA